MSLNAEQSRRSSHFTQLPSAPMRAWFHVLLLSASQCPPPGATLRLPVHMSGYYSRSRRERGDYCAGWRRRGFEGMTRGKCARACALSSDESPTPNCCIYVQTFTPVLNMSFTGQTGSNAPPSCISFTPAHKYKNALGQSPSPKMT